MLSPFSAMASTQPGAVRRIASLLFLALLSVAVKAQGHEAKNEVKIRVINAMTGEPITDEHLNVALRADQIGSVAMGTDKKGIIKVDTGHATILRILSNMYADCRPRGELYTNYPIASILKSGITTGNLCSDAKPVATPGELILFEIPRTYVPTMPNPPVDSIPHSPR
jgi:hypothetical protein